MIECNKDMAFTKKDRKFYVDGQLVAIAPFFIHCLLHAELWYFSKFRAVNDDDESKVFLIPDEVA